MFALILFSVLMLLTANPSFAAEQTGAGTLSSDQFEKDSICAGCHNIIHSQWEGGMHSFAEIDPFYKKEAEMASNDTDGLTDTINPAGEYLSEQELIPLLVGDQPLTFLLEQIHNKVKDYSTGAQQFDDITMLAIRRRVI